MTPGTVLAVLLVVAVLAAIFAIEIYFGKQEREWKRIADDLEE